MEKTKAFTALDVVFGLNWSDFYNNKFVQKIVILALNLLVFWLGYKVNTEKL